MKPLNLLAALAIVSSFNAFAQYHNDIEPIKGARSDAKSLIKSFQLQNQNLDTGAPEYTAIYNTMFVPAIKVESDKLEKSLDAINQALSKDYSLIMSLKGKPQTTALKATIKIAEQRLADSAASMITQYYHAPIKSVITLNGSFSNIVKKCLTVLCVNQVKEDFVKWIKISSSINKKLDLETTSMDKVPNFSAFTKKTLQNQSDEALSVGNHLAVSLTKEEYQDIWAAEQKVIDDARIKKEAEEAAARAKAEAEAAEGKGPSVVVEKEVFGCDEIRNYSSDVNTCLRPYILKDNNRVMMSAAAFSPERYKSICESVGMKTTSEVIPGLFTIPEGEIDQFAVKSVICIKPGNKTHKDRLKYESKMLLESGITLITNPTYNFDDYYGVGISAKGRNNVNEICKFLGLNEAVEADKWEHQESWDKDFVVISPTQIKRENYRRIWTKVTCK